MGDIVNNTQVTKAANLLYTTTYESEKSEEARLFDVNDELINSWYGVAGDAFMCMANTIEDDLGITERFTQNSSLATDDLVYHFGQEDVARRDSVDSNLTYL